jgi:hypothetical protein
MLKLQSHTRWRAMKSDRSKIAYLPIRPRRVIVVRQGADKWGTIRRQAEAPAEPEPAAAQKQPGAGRPDRGKRRRRRTVCTEKDRDRVPQGSTRLRSGSGLDDCTASGGFSGGLAANWPRVISGLPAICPEKCHQEETHHLPETGSNAAIYIWPTR